MSTMKNGFECLKRLSKEQSLSLNPIPAGGWILEEPELIELMTKSRYAVRGEYFSRFPPSEVSMRKFLLERYLSSHDAMLFFVPASDGNLVGQVGVKNLLSKCPEIDSVMRYVSDTNLDRSKSKGEMFNGLINVINWAREHCQSGWIYLEVLSTNISAIRFYQKAGFREFESKYLYEVREGETISHLRVEREKSNVSYRALTMRLDVRTSLDCDDHQR